MQIGAKVQSKWIVALDGCPQEFFCGKLSADLAGPQILRIDRSNENEIKRKCPYPHKLFIKPNKIRLSCESDNCINLIHLIFTELCR